MANFIYLAVNDKGEITKGNIEAKTESEAISNLSRKNLRPVSLKIANQTSKKSFSFRLGKKISSTDLVLFTRQLSTMISAGVPVARALKLIADHTDNKYFGDVINDVTKNLESGANLADALRHYPKVFNSVYTNMVEAGESSGILDQTLNQLSDQEDKQNMVKKRIMGALSYPIVLITVTIIAFFALMFFVIPKISDIVTNLGGSNASLPTITIVMLAISHFFVSFWYVIVLIIVGIVAFIYHEYHTISGRYRFDLFFLKMPIIGELIEKVAIARFARIFSALMMSGLPILRSIEISAHSLNNSVYEKQLLDTRNKVENGAQFSATLTNNSLFPPLMSELLAVGEETGQIGQVLIKLSDFYENEVDISVSKLSSIIEPVVILIMGLLVGLIAASVMLPIIQLSQNIK